MFARARSGVLTYASVLAALQPSPWLPLATKTAARPLSRL